MDLKDKLPIEYLDRMQALLRDEYSAFLKSYENKAETALRFNTKKVRPETVAALTDEWQLEAVPWCETGFYYGTGLRPGLSPYHASGVFYIQEPSAMLTAEEAAIEADDIVLDLCAAPGGKSTQAACRAAVLVSNEPVPSRARILSSNIERMGFDNVIVTSAYPSELSAIFTGYFDKIIVDAPCSGEGMMRKDETAISEWSPENVDRCVLRQKEILDEAASMLKPGGRIVYSTCTFERSENEEQIADFLERHPDFEKLSEKRLWPHKERGEGHYCSVVKKSCGNEEETGSEDERERKTYEVSINVTDAMTDIYKLLKRHKIHVLRCGVEKGEQKTDRKGKSFYTPSHAEAMAKCYASDSGGKVDILDMDIADKYLRGETIDISSLSEDQLKNEAGEGWVTVYCDGYPLGNAKLVGSVLKNHYPKGLRKLS